MRLLVSKFTNPKAQTSPKTMYDMVLGPKALKHESLEPRDKSMAFVIRSLKNLVLGPSGEDYGSGPIFLIPNAGIKKS